MPLPDPDTPWPPPQWSGIYSAYRTWSAWYAGDTDQLAKVYEGGQPRSRPSQHAGGIVGAVSRFFWGAPPSPHQHETKLHVPAAADIAATSADLLYSDAPTLTVDDEATQARLDELFGPDTVTTLIESAEVESALGGAFLRAGWDRTIADRPIPSVVHPDSAIPRFKWGRLAEVTFHRVAMQQDGEVLRHLEHHVPGGIQHALYLGDSTNLGRMVPLDEHPDTAGLVDGLSDDGQTIPTGIDMLDVVYKPNVTPNRIWRSHQVGAHLGRSDLSGVEPLMDALDEAYTSWMRDVRLAKGRLIVPEYYLESQGRGQGASFDLDREVFTPVSRPPEQGGNSEITASQFAIRHQEHAATCAELWEKIVRGAGYSAQTFGLTGEVAMTATESNAREKKTLITRDKKARLSRMAIGQFAEILLRIDRQVFGSGIVPQRPDVDFPPAVSEQPKERAETARLLTEAEAISTDTKVRLVHPDWDDERVQNEVNGIMADRAPGPEMRA